MTTRRQQIIDTAAELFAARGFHGVSVHDIGAACGVSGPALYKHFRGKDALLTQVLTSIGGQLLEEARSRIETTTSPDEALDALIERHVDFATTHPWSVVAQEREWSNLDRAGRETVGKLQLAYIELWVGALSALRPDLDRSTAHAAVQGTFALISAAPHSVDLEGADLRALRVRMARGALLC